MTSVSTPRPPVILIEGSELTGKSYIISRLYAHFEPRYKKSDVLLDGALWINCDVGIFGGPFGHHALTTYLDLIEPIWDRMIFLEKFHISHFALMRDGHTFDAFAAIEKRLAKLSAQILYCDIEGGEEIYEQRLVDRLALYPHYQRIARRPQLYREQQDSYRQLMQKSRLPWKRFDTTVLPNDAIIQDAISWIQNDETSH